MLNQEEIKLKSNVIAREIKLRRENSITETHTDNTPEENVNYPGITYDEYVTYINVRKKRIVLFLKSLLVIFIVISFVTFITIYSISNDKSLLVMTLIFINLFIILTSTMRV